MDATETKNLEALAIICAGTRREFNLCKSHWFAKAEKVAASDGSPQGIRRAMVNFESMMDKPESAWFAAQMQEIARGLAMWRANNGA